MMVRYSISEFLSAKGSFSSIDVVLCVIEITPCNKVDKPLVVYRFSGNVMTFITMLQRFVKNEFNFWKVHGIMNTSALLQS